MLRTPQRQAALPSYETPNLAMGGTGQHQASPGASRWTLDSPHGPACGAPANSLGRRGRRKGVAHRGRAVLSPWACSGLATPQNLQNYFLNLLSLTQPPATQAASSPPTESRAEARERPCGRPRKQVFQFLWGGRVWKRDGVSPARRLPHSLSHVLSPKGQTRDPEERGPGALGLCPDVYPCARAVLSGKPGDPHPPPAPLYQPGDPRPLSTLLPSGRGSSSPRATHHR